MPEDEPPAEEPRYQVPLVRRPGRWDVPAQPTWRWPRPRDVGWHLASMLPFAGAIPVVTGEWNLFALVTICVVNALLNAARQDPDAQRALVPELDESALHRVREVLAAGGGLSSLPEAWQDAARRYVVAIEEAAVRPRRWTRRVLVGWPALVVLTAGVLVVVWPGSAPVRYPAAAVSAVWGAGLAAVVLVLARRSGAARARFLAG